jgi:hypothetical protein
MVGKNIFVSKMTIYFSLGLHGERQSYRKSLRLSKENSQHLKLRYTFIYFLFLFCGSFLPGLRIRIHFIRIRHFRLDTDPDADPIRIQGPDYESGFTDPIESGSNPDPEP